MSLVAFTVGFYTIQWTRSQYLGKTPEQIVAMGRSKWFDAYTKKYGLSTVDMADAEYKYGDALKSLNDRAIPRLDKKRGDWLKSMRKEIQGFSYSAHTVGEIIAGGGTIWRNINSTIHPDIEELIADSIKKKPMPSMKMMSYKMMMSELDTSIAKYQKDPIARPEEAKPLQTARKSMDAHWGRIEKLFASATDYDRTRFYSYLGRKIEVAKASDML